MTSGLRVSRVLSSAVEEREELFSLLFVRLDTCLHCSDVIFLEEVCLFLKLLGRKDAVICIDCELVQNKIVPWQPIRDKQLPRVFEYIDGLCVWILRCFRLVGEGGGEAYLELQWI